MKKKTILLITLLLLSLILYIFIPRETKFEFTENSIVQYDVYGLIKVKVNKQLSLEIISKLNNKPDVFSIGKPTKIVAHGTLNINKKKFYLTGDSICLYGRWKKEVWKIEDLFTKLQSLPEIKEYNKKLIEDHNKLKQNPNQKAD